MLFDDYCFTCQFVKNQECLNQKCYAKKIILANVKILAYNFIGEIEKKEVLEEIKTMLDIL